MYQYPSSNILVCWAAFTCWYFYKPLITNTPVYILYLIIHPASKLLVSLISLTFLLLPSHNYWFILPNFFNLSMTFIMYKLSYISYLSKPLRGIKYTLLFLFL